MSTAISSSNLPTAPSTLSAATAAALTGGKAAGGSSAASASAASATTAKEASERFLKLLVTQLQNQDPMNPVDNAQMTSQMAQISTVSGIEKLNNTVEGLTGQFVQMQAMQGASLVGKDVILKGDKLSATGGVAGGGVGGVYQVDAAANSVKAEILSPAGQVVDTLSLGAQAAGRHDFVWPGGSAVSEAAGYRFRITAASGNTPVGSSTLMRDKVQAVNTNGAALTLELVHNGPVPYAAIAAVD